MSVRYIFDVEQAHGYKYGRECFIPTELEQASGRYLVELDGSNIKIQSLLEPSPIESGYITYHHTDSPFGKKVTYTIPKWQASMPNYIRSLPLVSEKDGGSIDSVKIGFQKTWIKHPSSLESPGEDVLFIYHIKLFAGGEIKIYKDSRISYTIYGSGRPLISTTLGHLKKACGENFYDY